MKIAHILAAASLIAGIGVSTTATAQDYRGDRHDQRFDDRRGPHRDFRGDRRDDRRYGGDRYHGRNAGYNRGRRCRTEFRHHRRVQICR
jgi:Ni/Co efflux regulator RcnB